MSTQSIENLIHTAIEEGLLSPRDQRYVRNRLLSLLTIEGSDPLPKGSILKSIPDALNDVSEEAVRSNIIDDAQDEQEKLQAEIMDRFMPLPSTIEDKFHSLRHTDPKKATDYFYTISRQSNYIQTKRVEKNIHHQVKTDYGVLDITINLSKPEKDPKQIEKEKQNPSLSYPRCLLCAENEGYSGHIGHPARGNHRIISIELNKNQWFLQYSPYVYYNEHSIVFREQHEPMVINNDTFTELFDFVDLFPHYFIGSNADLPIVGGSILNHDHYQAGRYTFAMEKADISQTFTLPGFDSLTGEILHWPMTVFRLKSESRQKLESAAAIFLETWRSYSDPEADIHSHSEDTPHNTITPIVRHKDERYEIDIVLRNNRTSTEYPDGLFHPHQDVHHIKKENIGLIEVMGLAVLPKRLKEELDEVAHALYSGAAIDSIHNDWLLHLQQSYQPKTIEEARNIIQKETGEKFATVLEHAGVFKKKAHYDRFLHHVTENLRTQVKSNL